MAKRKPPADAAADEIELPLRIVAVKPPAGSDFCLQRGKDERVQVARSAGKDLIFEFSVRVKGSDPSGGPRFLGPFVQGATGGKFVYIRSGKMAGQADSCYERRAKIHLKGIDWPLIERLRAGKGNCLEARYDGTAKDGGPSCATCEVIGGWRVAN